MNLGRFRARMFQKQIVLLLLPVLALRLFIPAGFMPRFSEDFGLSVEMCHGDARSSVVIRTLEDTPPVPDNGSGNHQTPCAFAALGSFAAPGPLKAAIDSIPHDIAIPVRITRAPALRPTHRMQSSRAPPLPV